MATLNLAINAAGAHAGAVSFQNASISVQNSARAAGTAVSGVEKSISSFGSTLSHVFLAAGIATGIHDIVRTFIDFDSGIVRVGKSSGISGDQLKYLGDQFISMSTRIPQSTDELLKIGYAAGQLGVHGTENILKFTETIAKLSVTGNLSGEAAAKSLARILNVTKEGMGSVDKLASTIVQVAHGGNGVSGSAASESEIAFTATKVAQAGAPFGMKSADAVALAASYASIGVPAQIAATSTAKAMQTFSDAARAGDTLHGKLGEIAEVTGVTAAEFQKMVKDDPTQAFTKFVEGLGRVGKEGGNTKKILDDLGLSDERLRRAILPLAGSADQLTAKLKLAREEFANPQRLAAEAAKQFDTFGAQLTILKNSFEAFFLMQRDGASPLLTFLKNLNEAMQIMLGFKDATEASTPAVKYMVDAIEIFVTILEVWAGLKMAKLITDMMVSVLGLGEGIAKAGILTNPLLTAVLAVGVGLASWAIGKTLFDQFEQVRSAGFAIIEMLMRAQHAFSDTSKLVKTDAAELQKNIADFGQEKGTTITAMEQLFANGMIDSRSYPKSLAAYAKPGTHPMSAAEEALTANRAAGLGRGEIDPFNDQLAFLGQKMRTDANNEAPTGGITNTFMNNIMGAVGEVKKQFGDLFNMGSLTRAVKQLHKDEEPSKPQGDFTPEELEGFSNDKNSLAKMLGDLKLEGEYLKQNNLEQKVSETLAKAAEKSAVEDISNREELLKLIGDQIRLNATEKATRDINKQLSQQQQMVDLLRLTDDQREVETQYLQLTNKYQEEGIHFSDSYLAGIKAQIKAMQQEKQEIETIQNIAHGIGDAFGNAFETAIMGAKSFGEVMKSLIQDIEKTLIHEMITKQLVKGVTGLVSGAFGLGGGGQTAQVGDYGGEAGPAYVAPHALGDIFSSPTYFNYGGTKHVTGEGGTTDALMPLGRDSQGRLGVRGGGGNNITIYVSSPNADSFRKSMPQTAAAARRAMGGR